MFCKSMTAVVAALVRLSSVRSQDLLGEFCNDWYPNLHEAFDSTHCQKQAERLIAYIPARIIPVWDLP